MCNGYLLIGVASWFLRLYFSNYLAICFSAENNVSETYLIKESWYVLFDYCFILQVLKNSNHFLLLLNYLYTQLHLQTMQLACLHQYYFLNEHLAHQYCTLLAQGPYVSGKSGKTQNNQEIQN